MRNNSQSNGKEKQNTETENDTDFNVETRTGKNHVESTNSETEHYERKEYNQRSQRQRPRDPASPIGGYGARTLSLTLVHSHSYRDNNLVHSNFTITHTSKMIALSAYILM